MQPGQTPTFVLRFQTGAPPAMEPFAGAVTDRCDGAWVHLDRRLEASREWAEGNGDIEPLAINALFEEDTHPRYEQFERGELLILRAVNLLPGADPEDMVSLRIWIEPNRVVSVSGLALRAVDDARERSLAGDAPLDPGQLVALLAARIDIRALAVVKELDDMLGAFEDAILSGDGEPPHGDDLLMIRRRTIWMRRFLAPQTEALEQIVEEEPGWISDKAIVRLNETADAFRKMTEALDAIRDHATAVQDQLATLGAERTNRTLYNLTIAAAIFLPVNLIAALLGANVGGVPGADSPLGFVALCAGTGIIVAVELAALRYLRLI